MVSNAFKICAWILFAGYWLLLNICDSRGASFTYSNTNFITINDSVSPPTIASPYPSTNFVSGLAGQVVTKVTVALHGFSHTFPSDVDILLVGPQGQEAILMANAGGKDRYIVTNLTLMFDDGAANALPLFTNLVSGTFKPTNGYLDPYFGYSSLPFNFPPPAPPGNSNSPALLSVFKNTDPNGAWNLFVVSDVSGDSGMISDGWDLNLSVAVPLQISRNQTNVVVSWPATTPTHQLQSAPNVSTTAGWTNILAPAALISGHYYVTNPILNGAMFYRLTN
jgi:hypothetical protein